MFMLCLKHGVYPDAEVLFFLNLSSKRAFHLSALFTHYVGLCLIHLVQAKFCMLSWEDL